MTSPEFSNEPTPEELADSESARRRAIFGLVGGFLVVLLGIVAVQWITDNDDTDSAANTVLANGEAAPVVDGDPLPEFSLTTLDGEPFELTSIIGTPTVLNFFASWCAPCRAELPEFQAVSQAVLGEVNFLGINTRETDVAGARQLLSETGVTYPVVLGDDGSLFEMVGGLAMPTTAFVNAQGIIVEVHSGVLRGDDLETKIKENFG